MKIEILVAAMKNQPESLISTMNINSDAIIANQVDQYSFSEIIQDDSSIKIINTPERGVGKNRNLALDRASGDICVLADDDEKFVDNYDDIIQKTYKKYPNYDIIIFNLKSSSNSRHVIKKPYRVNRLNFMRFGAARITFLRKNVSKMGIHFNLHFGGGTEHSAGEDVLFLNECLKKGLRIIAVDETIAELDNDSESTWFKGYTEKFFEDRGTLYATVAPNFSYLLCLSSAIRHYKLYKDDINRKGAIKAMFRGIQNYKHTLGYR